MVEQYRPRSICFEQKDYPESISTTAQMIEEDSRVLADVAMRFARVSRVPRYDEVSRENNAEHSFMLSLVATELAKQYFPDLNPGLVSQFATVHDLVELKTGDLATFSVSDQQLQSKAEMEHLAVEELCRELPPYTGHLLRIYEEQSVPESRFVRFVDKLLPVIVDILGPGSKVMHEDYETFTHEQLEKAENILRQRFEVMFPEPEFSPLHIARNSLAKKFTEVFRPMMVLQDALF